MPVVVRTREYGSPESYRDFMPRGSAPRDAGPGKRGGDIEDLWK